MKRKTFAVKLNLLLFIINCLAFNECKKEDAPPPVVISVAPNYGYPGTPVTITGSNFDAAGDTYVSFNNNNAVIISSSTTQIVAEVPDNAGTGDVSVFTRGTRISAGVFNFKAYPKFGINDPKYVVPFEATLNGQISDIGSEQVKDYGFIYASSQITSINSGTKISLGDKITPGPITVSINSLTKNKQYFAVAYVSTTDTTILSSQTSFTTPNTNEWIKVSDGFTDDYDAILGIGFGRNGNFLELNDKAYLVGSVGTKNGETVVPVFEYSPTQGILTREPDFPGPYRSYCSRFVLDNKIYLGMGQSPDPLVGTPSDFYSFNPTTQTWNRIADFGGIPMSSGSSVTLGNLAYVGFGIGQKTFWQYNTTNDSWTQKSSPLSAGVSLKRVLMAVSINDKAYFAFDLYSAQQVWEYTPLTDVWMRKTDFTGILPENPGGLSSVSLTASGKGYLIDGGGSIWEYNPMTDQWKTIPDSPNKSTFDFGVAIKNKIFLGSKSNVYVYTPE